MKIAASVFLSLCAILGYGSSTTEHVDVPTTKEAVVGEWISVFKTAKDLAETTQTPLVMVWSGDGCTYCNTLKKTFLTEAFKKWQAETEYVFCLVQGDSEGKDTGDNANSGAKKYAADGKYGNASSGGWPYVSVSWNRATDPVRKNFTGRRGTMPDKTGETLVDRFTNSVEALVGEYRIKAKFLVGNTAADRLEFDENTTSVQVPYVGLDGETAFLTVNTAGKTEDITVKLELEGTVYGTTTIHYVAESENTPKNPLWIGERDEDTLAAGEWTMDRDLALDVAAEEEGSTLTLLGGPLWCPDCVNNDKFLVDTEVFKRWAATKGVYCAAIDEPIFASGLSTPTLLSYESFDVSWLDGVTSGAGYLSRKMIPYTGNGGTNATAILARNLNLATNAVENGGLCRPECLDEANTWTGKWKTGIPCFVMQNAAGEIKGRLYQFSNVSPTNDESAAAYVQRLEELRELADDPTEELNQHWLTATTEDCEISLSSVDAATSSCQVSSTISAIDTSDFWRLADRETSVKVTFAVGGAAGVRALPETNARLNLWRVTKATATTAASATKVASAEGDLAAGFTLADKSVSADSTVDYFIQLEAIDTSDAFRLDHAGDSAVEYELAVTVAVDSGDIAFGKESTKVTEADAKKAGGTLRVYVPMARTGGSSGEVSATVTVDEDLTTAFSDRYEIVQDTASWDDGELGSKSIAIDVFDDANADGTQQVVLRYDESVFTLTIVDNDKANVGKLALAGAVPASAKKGTVIAEEGSTIEIGVTRVGGASGDVGCTLKATAGEFAESPSLAWASREAGEKRVKLILPELADCKAGKVTVSFAALSGISADTSAKTLAVQLVAADAPRFEVSAKTLSLVRYCVTSQEVAIVNLAEGATAKVTKLSGTLPGGVSVKAVGSNLLIVGTPTKAGSHEAVYQVSQTVNRKTTAGLTICLAFDVIDVAALDPTAPGANTSVAKSRTFGDQPVVDAETRRLTGVLSNLTIPPTGRCSAKYKCKAGTIALASTGWSSYDPETGELGATLAVAKKAYSLCVRACANGEVHVALTDPDFAEGELASEVAEGWSAAAPATDWLGYYTAAVDSPDAETRTGTLLAAGNPILTLKMQTAALAKKGLMSYAGVLPNGQAFSGSGTLVRSGLDTVILPVYYRTAKEFFTLAPEIKANKPQEAVECGEEILPWWTHTESVSEGSFEIGYLRIAGSYYDTTLDLLETLDPMAAGHELTAADAIDPITVNFTAKTLTLDKTAAQATAAKLSFAKATGLISGSFRTTNAAGRTVTATYKGVALPDWGDGCPNCGDIPWASGAFWFADTVPYELKGREKSLSVKRGDVLYVESN